jgi:hypothetical protein
MTYDMTLRGVHSCSCVTGRHAENTERRDGDVTQVVYLLLTHAVCMSWGSIFEHLLFVLENDQCIF